MNAETNLWDKLTGVVIFLLFIAGLLGVAVWYFPLIKQNEAFRKRILVLDARINKERETKNQLQAAIEALRRDPKAVERLMRERLGYAKPGETVIRFDPPVTNAFRQF